MRLSSLNYVICCKSAIWIAFPLINDVDSIDNVLQRDCNALHKNWYSLSHSNCWNIHDIITSTFSSEKWDNKRVTETMFNKRDLSILNFDTIYHWLNQFQFQFSTYSKLSVIAKHITLTYHTNPHDAFLLCR